MKMQNKLEHLAIIMDGNRRWAAERGMPKFLGHTEGAKNIKTIGKAAIALGIPYLTLYTLSTENLKRSEEELSHLFSLMEQLVDYLGDLMEHDVRLRTIGDLNTIPEKPRQKLLDVVEQTKENKTLTLTLAIAYGGRDELVRVIKKLICHPELVEGSPARRENEGNLSASSRPSRDFGRDDKITEEIITQHLDTAGYPDVDLVIRTGGHQRLSNFLLWQAAYAELYFTDTYWPAFTLEDLKGAMDWFHAQERKGGK